MSYCRWHDGDLYAYRGQGGYHVLVVPSKVGDRIKLEYVEASAQALLARILWLGEKGCHYPWDALRWLKEDVVAELEEWEQRDLQGTE